MLYCEVIIDDQFFLCKLSENESYGHIRTLRFIICFVETLTAACELIVESPFYSQDSASVLFKAERPHTTLIADSSSQLCYICIINSGISGFHMMHIFATLYKMSVTRKKMYR